MRIQDLEWNKFGSGNWDPEWKKFVSGIQDKHPGSATMIMRWMNFIKGLISSILWDGYLFG
jgi:hypothetical protein